MPASTRTMALRWALDVVDKGGPAKLLKEDRALRRGLEQTDKAWSRMARTATTVSARQAAATQRTTRAHGLEDRSVRMLSRSLVESSRAHDSSIAANRRAASVSERTTQAYRTQARASQELNRSERARRTASRAGAGAVGAGVLVGGAARRGASRAGVGLAAGLAAITGAKQVIQFDAALRNVNSIAQLSEKRLQGVGKELRALAGKSAQAPKTLAEGMYDLVSSGFSASKSLLILRSSAKAATAGLTDTKTSTKAVAAVLNAYHRPASAAANVSDTLFQTVNKGVINFEDLAQNIGDVLPFASSLGVGLDQVGASISTMTKAGISAPETMTRIKSVMEAFIKPSDAMAAAIKKTGAESGESLVKNKGFQGALETLIKTTDGSKSSVAKLFPNIRALGGALALTGKNTRGAESDLKSFHNVSGATDKALAQQSKSITYQWNRLKAQASSLTIGLGTKLLPTASKVLNVLSHIGDKKAAPRSLLAGISAGLAGRPPPIDNPASRIGAGAGRVGRTTASVATRVADRTTSIATGTAAVASSAAGQVAGAGKELIAELQPLVPFLQNVVMPLLHGLAVGVGVGVVVAFKLAGPAIGVLGNALHTVSPALGTVVDVGTALVHTFGLVPIPLRVAIAALGLLGRAAAPIRPIFTGLGGAIGFLATGPIRTLGTATGGVIRIVRGLIAPLRLVIGVVGSVRTQIAKVPGAISSVQGSAGSAAKSVVGAITSSFNTLRSLPGRVFSYFGKVGDRFASIAGVIGKRAVKIGTGIVSGVAHGIRDAAGAIASAVGSVAKRAFDKAKGGGVPFVPGIRTGGRIMGGGHVRRYQGGGLVPILASGGEMLVDGGYASMIPGPSNRDGTPLLVNPGAAVITGHGQQLLAGGASMGQTLAHQLPHFRSGGTVGASMYGGPSDHSTKKPEKGYRGDLLENAPMTFAELQMGKALGGLPYRAPITVSYGGRSLVVRKRDIGAGGGDVNGKTRAIDLYYRAAAKLGFNGLGVVRWSSGASAGAGGKGTSGSADVKVPRTLGRSRTRGGLIDDAFSQALDAARGGQSIGRYAISDQLREALGQVQTTRTISGGAGGGALGKVTPRVAKMAAFAARAAKRFPKYKYGGGHGSFKGPYDCSGYDSAILHSGGFLSSPRDTTGLKSFGQKGEGKQITIGVRGSSGRAAHTMIRLGSSFWEAGRGGVGRRSGWSGSFPIKRHPKGYRRGGSVAIPSALRNRIAANPRLLDPSNANWVGEGLRHGGRVRRMRTGGLATTLNAVSHSRGGSLDAFVAVVDNSLSARLETLRKQLLARVQRGGDAKVVSRLQAALSAIDNELGTRVGRLLRLVDLSKASAERKAGALDRLQRRSGIDPSSTAGLSRSITLGDDVTVATARANVSRLKRAVDASKRAGQGGKARELQTELDTARDDLDEALTTQVEKRRDLIKATAQERVDASQFQVDLQQGALAGLDVSQRLNRTADTPAGIMQRARATQAQIIPALQAQRDALANQYAAAVQTGDVAGARQTYLALQSAGNDLVSAMADVADAFRQAAELAAQDLVDVSGHNRTMVDLGEQRLELEQRLAGTYDTGAQERASYINDTLIPALNAELAALSNQALVAAQQGDPILARQVAEAIASKTNDILQAQLDAQQQIADNTQPRKVGGTLGFNFGSETLTDALIGVGNGS